MDTNELLKHLRPLQINRISLYLSEDKMRSWYVQKVSQYREQVIKETKSGKVGGGISGVFHGEAGVDKGTESIPDIEYPVVQGMIAENAARKTKTLIDLSTTDFYKGELLYYLGAARITNMIEKISPERTGLSLSECTTIEEIRNNQEGFLKYFDPQAGTIVLTFKANRRVFASIGELPYIIKGRFASYSPHHRFGLLCTLESVHDEVVFLDPIWIWFEWDPVNST